MNRHFKNMKFENKELTVNPRTFPVDQVSLLFTEDVPLGSGLPKLLSIREVNPATSKAI